MVPIDTPRDTPSEQKGHDNSRKSVAKEEEKQIKPLIEQSMLEKLNPDQMRVYNLVLSN